MRNLLVHEYGRIDDGLVFETVRDRLGDFGTFRREVLEFLRRLVSCVLDRGQPALHYTDSAMDPADELVDIVDEDDRVVATATRREVRRRALLHRCTYVLLRNAVGEILVHRRTDTKDIFPGAYDVFAGGVCAAAESYDDCARREVAEELGVVGANLMFLFKHRYRGSGGQAWGAVYEGRWDGAVRPQEIEVAWHAWVGPRQLDRMLGELPFCPDSREIFERLRTG